MGMTFIAREKKENVYGFANMEYFKNVDKEMFIVDGVPEIQFTTTARKLFRRLELEFKLDKGMISREVETKELFILYKELKKVISEWSPNPESENEKNVWIYINWLYSFLDVCLSNGLMVSLSW